MVIKNIIIFAGFKPTCSTRRVQCCQIFGVWNVCAIATVEKVKSDWCEFTSVRVYMIRRHIRVSTLSSVLFGTWTLPLSGKSWRIVDGKAFTAETRNSKRAPRRGWNYFSVYFIISRYPSAPLVFLRTPLHFAPALPEGVVFLAFLHLAEIKNNDVCSALSWRTRACETDANDARWKSGTMKTLRWSWI